MVSGGKVGGGVTCVWGGVRGAGGTLEERGGGTRGTGPAPHKERLLFPPNRLSWVWEEVLEEFFILKPNGQDPEPFLSCCECW